MDQATRFPDRGNRARPLAIRHSMENGERRESMSIHFLLLRDSHATEGEREREREKERDRRSGDPIRKSRMHGVATSE